MHKLYGIYYSPWSEKARWALDYHKISYEWIEFTPIVDNVKLMWQAKKFGRLTVPTLITPFGAVQGSLSIVRYAEKQGRKEKLIPYEKEEDILRLDALAEVVFKASRAIITEKIKDNLNAQKDLLPKFIPENLQDYFTPVASIATTYLGFKYSFSGVPISQQKEVIRSVLQEIRPLVRKNKTILGKFSLADIVVSLMFQFIFPVSNVYIPLTDELREVFTQKDLSLEFSDLIEWRDYIYSQYRK